VESELYVVLCVDRDGNGICDILGDLNGDGRIDAPDLQMLVNLILGNTRKAPCDDLNGDDMLNAADLQAMVNTLLLLEGFDTKLCTG